MDAQANATSSLGIDKSTVTQSVYDALVNDVPIDQIVMLTKRMHLDLVPSTPALSGAEVELVSVARREYLLAQSLASIAPKYDYVFIDSPPSLGLLTLNALTAADAVIVPIQCEYLALEGLSQLLNTIQLVQQSLNPRLRIAGLAMTMFDSRTHLALQVVEEVAKHFPELIFRSVIPRSVRVAEAPSFGEPLVSYDPHSRGAKAYEELTVELLARETKSQTKDGRPMTEDNPPSSVLRPSSGSL
jgi:chromosome partitioning protein